MVEVRSLNDAEGFVQITADVVDVLKKSATKPLSVGNRLALMKQPKCEGPVVSADQIDHFYLVMGKNAGLTDRELMLDDRVYMREAPMLPERARVSKFYRHVKKFAKRAKC